jgi:hypothetical protein
MAGKKPTATWTPRRIHETVDSASRAADPALQQRSSSRKVCGSVPRSSLFCLCSILLLPALSLAASVPKLEANGDTQGGNLTLSWSLPEAPPGVTFQVQQAQDASFEAARDVYRGQHTGSVVSGLRDGRFHFRVRYQTPSGWSGWSEPVAFRVEHPPLSTALALFALGAVVFGATAWVVVRGTRETVTGRGDT